MNNVNFDKNENWKNLFPKEDRYFETKKGILYYKNCLKIMPKFPKNVFNAIITDPPYGKTQGEHDKKLPLKDMWFNIKRLRKDNAVIILFGYGLFFYELCLYNKEEFRYDLIWNKVLTSGFLNANRMPLRQHEQIAIFYKKFPTYNPQMEKGEPLHSKGISYRFNSKITNNNYGKFKIIYDSRAGEVLKYPKSILKFQKPHPSQALHPTQKSLELMEYLIKTYTNEGDLVLDFTCGSGTTLVACERLNRYWVGIENREKYCKTAKERIKREAGVKRRTIFI